MNQVDDGVGILIDASYTHIYCNQGAVTSSPQAESLLPEHRVSDSDPSGQTRGARIDGLAGGLRALVT